MITCNHIFYSLLFRARTVRLVLVFTICLTGYTQTDYDFFRAINTPVYQNDNLLKLAWVGGLNSPQFSKIDLNGDGLEDLFIFDREDHTKLTFINEGGIGANYTYSPQYETLFPTLQSWVLLRDYDNDGKKDIFTFTSGGIVVYKNTTPTGGVLTFEQVTNPYIFSVHPPNATPINLFATSLDIPAIADIDGDGDLDILTIYFFTSSGIPGIVYHRNYSMEVYGHADSLLYELKNDCWGHFTEDFSATTHFKANLRDTCSNPHNNPESKPYSGSLEWKPNEVDVNNQGELRHTSACLLTLDINGDGVQDLIIGDSEFRNMLLLVNDNKGVNMNTSFIEQDTVFPKNSVPISIATYPAAYYEDIDNDGVKDLIASPNETATSNNHNSAWFYKNEGSNNQPQFVYQKSNLFQDQMLEFGSNAKPVFVDYDGDGLMDIIVGNYGYFNTSSSTYQSRLALLKNIGTASQPAYSLLSSNFANLSNVFGIGINLSPAFGDIDNDGDIDMIIGDHQGFLHYFENTAGFGNPANFVVQQTQLRDYTNAILDVGQNASPILFDIDNDGDLDLIVGNSDGKLYYIENRGTLDQAEWEIKSTYWGEVDVSEWFTTQGNATPTLYLNSQNEMDLFVGSQRGAIFHYNNIEANIDSGAFNLVDSLVGDIQVGSFSKPTLADINGNGKPEMLVGIKRGGIAYYASTLADTYLTISTNETEDATITIYPNPSSDIFTVKFDEASIKKYNVFGLNGVCFVSGEFNQTINQLDLRHLPEGVYYLTVESDSYSKALKLIKL